MTQWFISDTHFGHDNILNFKTGRCDCGATAPEGSWGKGQFAIHTLQCSYITSPYVRAFNSTEEMDETMVKKWNDVVRPGDHVWHLGDVTMNPSKYLGIIRRLAGIKGLVLGNHDSGTIQQYLAAGFKKIASYRVYDKMLFSHIPIHPASLGRFDANVHGHTHSNHMMKAGEENRPGLSHLRDRRYVNVSVEAIDYAPISLEQIKRKAGL
jgi:calcineurin-like phosphoesterase family protein